MQECSGGSFFISHMKEVHDKVQRKIAHGNKQYKVHSNLRRCFAELKGVNMVMIHIKQDAY